MKLCIALTWIPFGHRIRSNVMATIRCENRIIMSHWIWLLSLHKRSVLHELMKSAVHLIIPLVSGNNSFVSNSFASDSFASGLYGAEFHCQIISWAIFTWTNRSRNRWMQRVLQCQLLDSTKWSISFGEIIRKLCISLSKQLNRRNRREMWATVFCMKMLLWADILSSISLSDARRKSD